MNTPSSSPLPSSPEKGPLSESVDEGAVQYGSSDQRRKTDTDPQHQCSDLQKAGPQRYRLHHSYIWLSAFRTVPYLFIAFFFSLYSVFSELLERSSSGMMIVLITAVASLAITVILAACSAAFAALSYRFKWYEFGVTEFSFCSGIFNKKRSHVPYQRVQSVNEKVSLLQRFIGVCTVTIDTAGGSANKAIMVPYVERSAAERIRRELFMRKNLMAADLSPEETDERMMALRDAGVESMANSTVASRGAAPLASPFSPDASRSTTNQPDPYSAGSSIASPSMSVDDARSAYEGNILDMPANILEDMRGVFAQAAVDTGEVSCEFGLSNKELILSAVSGKTSFALVLIGVVSALSTVIGWLVDSRLIASDEAVYSVAWQAMGSQLGAFLLVSLLGALVLLWVLSVTVSCLSYAGFRARRRGDRIEVERGLITHVFSGMDVDRIQSIHIHQSFFQRLLGCCSVAYGRVGAMSEDKNSNSMDVSSLDKLIVHPFLPLSQAQEVIEGLTPEYRSLPQPTKPVSKKALRRGITRRTVLQGFGFWLIVIVMITWMILLAFAGEELDSELMMGMTLHRMMILVSVVCIVAALIIAVFEAIGAVLWYKKAAMGWDRFGLTVINGGYSTDTVTIPRTKIQSAQIRTNPLQRYAGLATVSVSTAAGVSVTKHKIQDTTRTDAEDFFQWVRPRAKNR